MQVAVREPPIGTRWGVHLMCPEDLRGWFRDG